MSKMKMSIVGILIAVLMSFTAVNSFAGTAKADTQQIIAKVNLTSAPLGIVSTGTALDFSNMQIPTGAGTTERTLAETLPDAPKVTITGPAAQVVTLTGVAPVVFSSCSPGLTLDQFSFPNTNTITANGTLDVPYGATLTVRSNASTGPQTCKYTISVNF